MSEIILNANQRDGKNIPDGAVLAVVYGHGRENIHISVDGNEFIKVLREAGKSTIVSLNIADKTENVFIHAIDYHPVTDRLRHVDFYIVRMDEETTAEVPFKIVGVSPAVKNLNGMIMVQHKEVEVTALPADIPHEIEIDISALVNHNDSIHLKDLPENPKYKIKLDPSELLVTVLPPRKVEEETPAEGEEVKPEDVKTVADEKAAEKTDDKDAKKDGKKDDKKEKK